MHCGSRKYPRLIVSKKLRWKQEASFHRSRDRIVIISCIKIDLYNSQNVYGNLYVV